MNKLNMILRSFLLKVVNRQRRDGRTQLADGEMVNITLCSGDTGVAQQLGDGDDVSAGAQAADRIGVTQRMGRDSLRRDPSGKSHLLDQAGERPGTQAAISASGGTTVTGQEQGTIGPEKTPGLHQVVAQQPVNLDANGHDAVLPAFALAHEQRNPTIELLDDVRNTEGGCFSDPQPGSKEDGKDGAISSTGRRLEDGPNFAFGEHRVPHLHRGTGTAEGNLDDIGGETMATHAAAPGEETSQRRQSLGLAGWRDARTDDEGTVLGQEFPVQFTNVLDSKDEPSISQVTTVRGCGTVCRWSLWFGHCRAMPSSHPMGSGMSASNLSHRT